MISRVPTITRPTTRFHNLVGADSILIRKVHDEAYIHVSVEHFHPEINHGDRIRWGATGVRSICTYSVLTNVSHPRGVRGLWWAELLAHPRQSVTVAGYTYWSWKLGNRKSGTGS
jgi:hypothetical protein